jgi:holo-[acyl-carrier protein] synthase
MGVVNARSGQPTLALTGGAARRLAAITPEGYEPRVHLSLTDDHPYAQAFVVIEAVLPHERELTGRGLAAARPSV